MSKFYKEGQVVEATLPALKVRLRAEGWTQVLELPERRRATKKTVPTQEPTQPPIEPQEPTQEPTEALEKEVSND